MNQREDNNLWLLLEALARRRSLIFSMVIICTLGSLGISFLLPKWYKAEALLLPPKNMTLPITDFETLSNAVSVTSGLNLPVLATPSDIYVRIMKSRSICTEIINDFNLRDLYGTNSFDATYKALMGNSSFSVTDEGLLAITVEDKSPELASDMANAFVDKLDVLNRKIVSDRIKQTGSFVKARITEVKKEMDSVRGELEDFQMKYKAVDFDEQTRLAINQAANFKINLSEIDFELRLNEITLGENNAEIVELKRKKEIIEDQLSNLENENSDSSFFSLPVASIPAIKGQYELLYSRVKVSEGLYQILLNQQEQIKMKELERMPTITVLDRAIPPELKSRPKKSYIVISAFVLSLIFSMFLAVFLEYFKRLEKEHPEDYTRALYFINAFFGWLPGIKKVNK